MLQVSMTGETPTAIADLASIGHDMQFVVDACDALIRILDELDPASPDSVSHENEVRIRAYWDSAIIAGRRGGAGTRAGACTGRRPRVSWQR